jgi:hypothetical protein
MIALDNPNRLSDRTYPSLTEAMTWILDGHSRNDAEINVERGRAELQNDSRWGSYLGPSWLKPCLEHLRSDPQVELSAAIASDELEQRLPSARRWLEKSGLLANAAYAQVCAELDRRGCEAKRQGRLYALLFDGCAAERFQLKGILQQANPHRVHIPYTPIPADYFLRPVYHIMGRGYYGDGQVGPDRTDTETFDSLFSYSVDADRRPTYVRVLIRRIDALALRVDFEKAEDLKALPRDVSEKLNTKPRKPGPMSSAPTIEAYAKEVFPPHGTPPLGMRPGVFRRKINEKMKANGLSTLSDATLRAHGY